MNIKLKASLMYEQNLDDCSNITLFHINNGKVIGTSFFHSKGCEINVINYETRKQDFDLMILNGLYDIFGSLNDLELNQSCEISIFDDKLLSKARSYVKKNNIYCEEYKKDELDRKLGI